MALIVLKVPKTSISMTDLNALELMPSIGAIKLPAAPALSLLAAKILIQRRSLT